MVLHRIDREADHLDAPLVELGLQPCDRAELGGADRGVVLGMREQHHPAVAGPVVEAELPFGGLRGEVRRGGVDRQRHGEASLRCLVAGYLGSKHHDANAAVGEFFGGELQIH